MTLPIHFNSAVYDQKPLRIQGGIPVFSERDSYVENYEKIAADHVSQITKTQENPFMEQELWVSLERQTRAIIRKYVPEGQRILDVGVGLGRLLEPLTEYERYGVDISLDYLTIAKSRGIEVALAKIEDLPYAKGYFDAVVVCDVLEHVFDLHYCCRRIIECLRPGGILIVRVPYKEDLDVYLNEDLPYEFIHMRSFDEAGLRLLFQKIFRLQFLESATSTPYLQGAPRLKFRALQESARNQLSSLAKIQPELSEVASAFDVSEEKFVAWIYQLKSTAPEVYKAVVNDLVLGIEIDCVFRKPFDHALGDLRATAVMESLDGNASEESFFSRELSALRAELDKVPRQQEIEAQSGQERVVLLQTTCTSMRQEAATRDDQILAQNQSMEAEFRCFQSDTSSSLLSMEARLALIEQPWHKKLIHFIKRKVHALL